MSIQSFKKSRTIDTFAARELSIPDGRNPKDSIGEYSLRGGYGLGLRRRRVKRKKKIIVWNIWIW